WVQSNCPAGMTDPAGVRRSSSCSTSSPVAGWGRVIRDTWRAGKLYGAAEDGPLLAGFWLVVKRFPSGSETRITLVPQTKEDQPPPEAPGGSGRPRCAPSDRQRPRNPAARPIFPLLPVPHGRAYNAGDGTPGDPHREPDPHLPPPQKAVGQVPRGEYPGR